MSSARKLAASPTPATVPLAFRIFSAEESGSSSPNSPSPSWTLRQFVEWYVRPNYLAAKKRHPETFRCYDQVVRLWEELCPGLRTLREIEADRRGCQAFVEKLKSRRGLKTSQISDNTVRKICTHAQKIFDLAGPINRNNRNAAQVMGNVPYLERPSAVREAPDGDFTLDEIGMWLGVCREAQSTGNLTGINQKRWWSCLVIFCYNTGLRIDTVMSATWDMVDRRRPDWITIPARIYKGRKHGGDFYLNAPARAAIESLRLRSKERLFPWRDWPASQGWLQECRRRMLARTDLPEHRRFGFHGLREALGTYLSSRNPMVASIVLGHKSMAAMQSCFSATTRDFYANHQIVREYMDQVPQPIAREPNPQRLLFEV
jgi:hypothetical protein